MNNSYSENAYIHDMSIALHTVKTMVNSKILNELGNFLVSVNYEDVEQAKKEALEIRQNAKELFDLCNCISLVSNLRLSINDKDSKLNPKYLSNSILFANNHQEISLVQIISGMSNEAIKIIHEEILNVSDNFLNYQGFKPTSLFFEYFIRSAMSDLETYYRLQNCQDGTSSIIISSNSSEITIKSSVKDQNDKELQSFSYALFDGFELIKMIVETLEIGKLEVTHENEFIMIRLKSIS